MGRSSPVRAVFIALMGGLILLVTLAACTWGQLQSGTENLRRLYIVGDLKHVSDKQVAQAAQAHLGAGFFEVQVDAIHDAVTALPWVATASVHRRWPDAVVVRVREHHAVARWGKHALVTKSGVVFTPGDKDLPAHMVILHGPKGSGKLLLEQLADLRGLLKPSHFHIARLRMDARGDWRMDLDDGLELRLGRADLNARLQRFVNHLSPTLNSRLEDAGYVDLRYADGFAVGGTRAHKLDQQGGINDKKA